MNPDLIHDTRYKSMGVGLRSASLTVRTEGEP